LIAILKKILVESSIDALGVDVVESDLSIPYALLVRWSEPSIRHFKCEVVTDVPLGGIISEHADVRAVLVFNVYLFHQFNLFRG